MAGFLLGRETSVVSVLFDSLDTNTRVSCTGREENNARRWDREEVLGVLGWQKVAVKVDRLGA